MGNDAPRPTRQLGREPSPPDASQQEPAQRGKLAGYTVGNYHLQALLGVGGMAEVYRAQDLGLSRTVAVKILFGQLAADPGYVARFRAEARRVATLKHPHIVQVFAYGEEAINGQRLLYLVMPLLQESLRHVLLREGRLPSDRATQLALQIAQALGAAHATGLVHRDVKPENILLDEERQALLGDFGIARELGGTSRRNATLAGTGLPVGTPEYMAPEQLRGGNVRPAGRSLCPRRGSVRVADRRDAVHRRDTVRRRVQSLDGDACAAFCAGAEYPTSTGTRGAYRAGT